jgi:Flp pilus assembly pilin Flp
MDLGMLLTYMRARLGVSNEKGQTLVEYALIISLIAIAAVLALGFLSGKINDLFSKTGSQL